MTESRIPVLVINLDADQENWARIGAQFAPYPAFSLQRIPGVPGSTLPQIACDILTKTPGYAVGRGALGVFLAHIAAWEAAAASDAAFCLILEDDVELLEPDRLLGFSLPLGVELVFCNEAMLPAERVATALKCLDMSVSLRALEQSQIPGPGAYGYLLTPAGAQALLAAVKRDLCFGHLDWRLVRYCVTAELVERTIPGTRVAEILCNHHHWERPSWGVVPGAVLSSSLVRHVWTQSRRAKHDQLPAEPDPVSTSMARHVSFEGRTTVFHISNPADHVQSFIHQGEFYQAAQLAFHRNLVPMGSTVIDVGANVGTHTMFYAKYTWASRVYPVEPNPSARTLLEATIAANMGSDCRAKICMDHASYAVGRMETWLQLLPSPENNLGGTALQQADADQPDAIHCMPLDKLAFEGPIGFLKIDVEGMEMDILKGAEFLIGWHRPIIAIEVAQQNEPAFWQWLNESHYQMFQMFAPYLECRDYLVAPIGRDGTRHAAIGQKR